MRNKKKSSSRRGPVELPNLNFKPKIADKQEQQGVLIACRGMEQYPAAVFMMANAVKARADQILLDYSQQGVAVRYRVDGIWENNPPMDRESGDGMLVVLKRLVNLNPTDRRSRQSGVLPLNYKGDDWLVDFVSQGIPTGERVLMKIEPKRLVLNTLSDLGMREKMQEQLRTMLNGHDALFLFSAAAGQGLPTLWRIGLQSADRFVRDFHIIEDVTLGEGELINVARHTYNTAAGETPMTVLKSLLLKQPDVLAFPDFSNQEVVKLVCEEIIEEHRFGITRTTAGSAVEAILKLLATYKSSAKDLIRITSGVINQRLIRRLCVACRQPYQPSPQLLQKLGIPPGRVQTLYQPLIPPPIEERVDANGKPIEIEICKKCGGRGYYGRAAIFELLQLNETLRKAILGNPTPEGVLQVARQQGFLTLQEEGVLAVATGLTSLQELQRVLAPRKA